jgi:hypothetical protein
VALPDWFSKVAPHLPPGQVVLTFPLPGIGASTLAWQAVDSLQFALATGAGPGSIPERAGVERNGQALLTAGSFSVDGPPKPTDANIEAVRVAIIGWAVTLIAVPNPKALVPPYDQLDSTPWALGMFTLALDRAPQFRGDTWVWTDAKPSGHHLSISEPAFAVCTSLPVSRDPSPLAVPNCVLKGSHQS